MQARSPSASGGRPGIQFSNRQAHELLNQVEAMVAAGPHGRLDEYLAIVDLLMNIKRLFEGTDDKMGLSRAQGLHRTAMEDLEYEFKEILIRRSEQSAGRLSPEFFRSIYQRALIDPLLSTGNPSGSARLPSMDFGRGSFSESPGNGLQESNSPTGDKYGGVLGLVQGLEIPEMLPESTVRWLHQTAQRMVSGGRSKECINAYLEVRSMCVRKSLQALNFRVVQITEIQKMKWEEVEKLAKSWMEQLFISVGVIMALERFYCSQVMKGMESQRVSVLAELLSSSGFENLIQQMVQMANGIISHSFIEQLFTLLDMYETLELVMPELTELFGSSGYHDVWIELEALPTSISLSALKTIEKFENVLKDVPSLSDILGNVGGKSTKKNKLFPLLRTASLSSDCDSTESDAIFDYVPRSGDVDPITSYVANYIKLYMQKKLRYRNANAFQRLLRHADEEREGGNSLSPPSSSSSIASSGGIGRGEDESSAASLSPSGVSLERVTAQLITALRNNLSHRATFYKNETLRELFLLNNINYLVKSMASWQGWQRRSLFKAITFRKDSAKDLMVAVSDLQDDRIVTHHANQLQDLALRKVLEVLSSHTVDSGNFFSIRGGDTAYDRQSFKNALNKLKKFNTEIDELKKEVKNWVIADEELRRKIVARWAMTLKDRYRKLLLPHWDELTNTRAYVHVPETLDTTIQSFFVKQATQNAEDE